MAEPAVPDHADVIVVRPGERIAADGHVLDGASDVDQAGITGEPLPAVKEPGDEVFAGTLNGTGVLTVRVSRAAADTVIARIVAMVAEASGTKARAQLFIQKIEQRYSAGMVGATVLLFIVTLMPFLTHMSGLLYLSVALVLNVIFLYYALVLKITAREELPMRVFKFSVTYLMWLFAALLADHYV